MVLVAPCGALNPTERARSSRVKRDPERARDKDRYRAYFCSLE